MINLHVDVDNLWVYEKEFDIRINKDQEQIYSQALPVLLNLLNKSQSKATFMIVGKDLKLKACQVFCRKAIAEGHEIANHSFDHPISFGTMSYEQKKQQIFKTHQRIAEVCGIKPVGFRGPGYYQDKEIITILQKLNYQYDASVIPGFAQILMSMYAYIKGGENRHKTFGRLNYILDQEHPHIVKGLNPNNKLLELPISVLPILRLPMHTTFAYFLGSWYRKLILNYLKSKPKYMLYLFHAIDFVDLPMHVNNHPIIPLRYSFNERINFLEDVLDILVQSNGRGLQTSRSIFKAIHH